MMTLKFLGTGTSQGIPVIGCTCAVCLSKNPKDQRFRSSAMITSESGRKILIDCGPDFRQQMLINNENHLDAILLTHEHNDHVVGLDDVRPLIFRNKMDMPLYCQPRVGTEVKSRFPYAFAEVRYPGAPSFELNEIDGPLNLFDLDINPVHVLHHRLDIVGFKIKKLAYITDASYISAEEKEKLKDLDYLILNCIRKTQPHPAHFILEDILALHSELKPRKLYLTHLSHLFGLHEVEEALLPEGIHLATDGLVLEF